MEYFPRNYGHFSELSVAFGGNIPYLIDRFLVTPGTLEGELPSPFGISSNSLSYSRFIKFSADYRRYVPITPNTLFSFRLFGGLDRKSTRLNSSHVATSYAVFCLRKQSRN